ncbi:MAG TPA: hypothetical protein VFG88_08515 [Nocardioidaceae bacterium]|jgi:hypothetical protein|nr:hypothetical protein [Nocardioidaceae bacterium]
MSRASTVAGVTAGLGAVALAAVLVQPGPPLQPLLVFAFLLVAPGVSVVGLLEPSSLMWHLVMGVAISIALGVAVAQVLLFMGVWSPELGLLLLVAVTWVAAGMQLLRRRLPALPGLSIPRRSS